MVRSVQNLRRRAGSTRPGRVTRTAGLLAVGGWSGLVSLTGVSADGDVGITVAGRNCLTVLAGPCTNVSKIVAPNRCARRSLRGESAGGCLGAADSAGVREPLVERVAQLGGVGIGQVDFVGDLVDSEGGGLVGLGGAVEVINKADNDFACHRDPFSFEYRGRLPIVVASTEHPNRGILDSHPQETARGQRSYRRPASTMTVPRSESVAYTFCVRGSTAMPCGLPPTSTVATTVFAAVSSARCAASRTTFTVAVSVRERMSIAWTLLVSRLAT